ncbi:uncharacterized protein HKW66_Vig0140440 [Vigna angularis]|uniref:Uncharacterized protein n=1 Tax=Phaseolus angularis TaxID=3914 RepID=A0A8T0KD08_PHAAN|nr:uncharacterized protein HKW66_Vig0140440 [Vigna angularis]
MLRTVVCGLPPSRISWETFCIGLDKGLALCVDSFGVPYLWLEAYGSSYLWEVIFNMNLATGFLALSTGIIYSYYAVILKVDEEEFGGHGALLQEGLFASVTLFLLSWILVYSLAHF